MFQRHALLPSLHSHWTRSPGPRGATSPGSHQKECRSELWVRWLAGYSDEPALSPWLPLASTKKIKNRSVPSVQHQHQAVRSREITGCRFPLSFRQTGDTLVLWECMWMHIIMPDSVMPSSASGSWSFWSPGQFQQAQSWSSFQWTPKHLDLHWSLTYPLRQRKANYGGLKKERTTEESWKEMEIRIKSKSLLLKLSKILQKQPRHSQKFKILNSESAFQGTFSKFHSLFDQFGLSSESGQRNIDRKLLSILQATNNSTGNKKKK